MKRVTLAGIFCRIKLILRYYCRPTVFLHAFTVVCRIEILSELKKIEVNQIFHLLLVFNVLIGINLLKHIIPSINGTPVFIYGISDSISSSSAKRSVKRK